ncbi:MAG: type I 3-dehydroquinate dehydratase [Candidatus Gracilibacteria bacterium]
MICVPLKQKTCLALSKELNKAQKIADLIEIWFDELGDLDDQKIKRIISHNKKPIIYKSQGALTNIKNILSHKINFIDLDILTDHKTINYVRKNFPKTKIIISFHDFKKTPDSKSLQKIANKISKKGADIIKIATYAKSSEDSFRMLEFLAGLSQKKEAICLCMGKHGLITRTSGHLFGNYLMYAPLVLEDKTADGQITAKELSEIQHLIPKLCH